MRSVQRASRSMIVVAALAAAGLTAAVLPAALAAGQQHRQASASPAGGHEVCAAPTRPGLMQCMSVVGAPAPASALSQASPLFRPPGYSPATLRSAYRLTRASVRRGRGETVAIVDAFRDPRAAHDLAVYRKHYRLPACSTAGRCLRIVNQFGRPGPLPRANAGWALEESLDLDMVSAICPRCHILLVEARSNSTSDLAIAEDTAVHKGAKFVSNSWNGAEFFGESSFNRYFNHPGVAITFAAGDSGYGTAYPTDIQYVTAVGGTRLVRAHNRRGWAETAWSGTGSGCSQLAAKASWQTADYHQGTGCLNRTGNDVAADASLSTGVSVYDSYATWFTGGTWLQIGGTSVATPIVAAVYALAGTPSRNTYPAEYPYLNAGRLFDVVTGTNGNCTVTRAYLCNAKPRYDGPTGLGTPAGYAAFSGGGQRVTLLDPGTLNVTAATAFSLPITGLDTDSRASTLAYHATGLPAGLSIAPVPHSTNAVISGTLPLTLSTFTVTVTATDSRTGRTGRVTFAIVVG